jgi:hypothetical protein
MYGVSGGELPIPPSVDTMRKNTKIYIEEMVVEIVSEAMIIGAVLRKTLKAALDGSSEGMPLGCRGQTASDGDLGASWRVRSAVTGAQCRRRITKSINRDVFLACNRNILNISKASTVGRRAMADWIGCYSPCQKSRRRGNRE